MCRCMRKGEEARLGLLQVCCRLEGLQLLRRFEGDEVLHS